MLHVLARKDHHQYKYVIRPIYLIFVFSIKPTLEAKCKQDYITVFSAVRVCASAFLLVNRNHSLLTPIFAFPYPFLAIFVLFLISE